MFGLASGLAPAGNVVLAAREKAIQSAAKRATRRGPAVGVNRLRYPLGSPRGRLFQPLDTLPHAGLTFEEQTNHRITELSRL